MGLSSEFRAESSSRSNSGRQQQSKERKREREEKGERERLLGTIGPATFAVTLAHSLIP